MKQPGHLLDSLLELQALDRLPRVGYAMRGVAAPESVAEHLFHVGFLVWAVGRDEQGLDLGKALEIALLHDLAEVRLGDLPRTAAGYFPPGVKAVAERAMLADILAPLAGAARPEDSLAEYQQGKSREARLVAACDKLQLLIKAYFYLRAGNRGAQEFFGAALEGFDDCGFEKVGELARELRSRLAAGAT